MNCIHLTVAFLALSACRPSPPRQLDGVWVGTIELAGDLKFIRAEFGSGLAGTLHLAGGGDLELVRASESGGQVFFEMRRGDGVFVFAGALRQDSIVGHVYHAREVLPFKLHRTIEIDRRLLDAYVGEYDSRSIEDCTDELGWQQLIYVDHRSGGRKALFPSSESSFFFGPGYLIPGPIQGTITFLGAAEGRASHLLVDQAGWEPRIAKRTEVTFRNARGCSPLRGSRPTTKAGHSG
jgi:hypothetical protein